ncbi:MAG: amino-acid N-acetyltransferase [Gammaproteobacteria bacterium]
MTHTITDQQFVDCFRHSSPYINAFRGHTFVIEFGGELIAEKQFANLVHDIALLNSLGIKLILVHGTRPQIESRLNARNVATTYVEGLRITDYVALECVIEAAGAVRVEIESLLSMGLANSPMAGSRIQATSGNFVTARPLGIIDGIDYQHTGEVRRIDHEAIQRLLDGGSIVLLSPLGYSPTGETFNLTASEVATEVACALGAAKYISLTNVRGLLDIRKRLIRNLTLKQAERLVSGKRKLTPEIRNTLASAIKACRNGVKRAHLIDRHTDGALLLELFTRDGVGTLIDTDNYEGVRQATINDIGGIMELILPLENDGTLIRRSRENLEIEIDDYIVVEKDGMIIACASLHTFGKETCCELACLAVHPNYQKQDYGDKLLNKVENVAKEKKCTRLFALTTRATHWFLERGFTISDIKQLPVKKRSMFNYQRKSRVLVKAL